MINHYAYWYFKNIFDDKFCQKVIDLGLQEIDNLKKSIVTGKGVLNNRISEHILINKKLVSLFDFENNKIWHKNTIVDWAWI